MTEPDVVCTQIADDGAIWYAELEPAPAMRRRSWRSWHTRWWWEIMRIEDGDTMPTTWAYQPGGSGGAWTRESALTQAWLAINKLMRAETTK